jgi:hypothetical protein
METLSESMMDQSALNDLPETDSGRIIAIYIYKTITSFSEEKKLQVI